MKQLNLVLLPLLFCATTGLSQQNPWQKLSTLPGKALIQKDKLPLVQPKLYRLSAETLRSSLKGAPLRSGRISSSHVVPFPNEEGKLANFSVVESSNMDPALAAKYPDIKSYVGKGIDDPAQRIYFSVSPKGFKSMLIRPGKADLVMEPYTEDKRTYVAHTVSESRALTPLECSVMATSEKSLQNASSAVAADRPNADDGIFRTYRVALTCNAEYTRHYGGTVADALAGMNATLTRINSIFERDFGIHLNLTANNDKLIPLDPATDAFSSNPPNRADWIGEGTAFIRSVLDDSEYDLTHTFIAGGGGGAASLKAVCSKPGSGFSSSAIPEGHEFDRTGAHEFGHQFGANHVFTFRSEGGNNPSQVEPGHGTSIMSYTNEPQVEGQPSDAPYFNAASIAEVMQFVKSLSCGVNTPTGNSVPIVDAGSDYTIPKSTPFFLQGTASDADDDVLTYNWEQQDRATQNLLNSASTSTTGPAFASVYHGPTAYRSFPVLSTVLKGATATTWEILPSVSRTMNFRFTVRDNHAGGPANNSDDMVVTVDAASGPFQITAPNTAVTWEGGSTQTITWDVAGTTGAPVSCANVRISLSVDGGLTFPNVLIATTPNDGTESITVPNTPNTTARIKIEAVGNVFYDISNTNFYISNTGVYEITSSATPFGFGTINPKGATPVIGGSSQTYTMTPTENYAVRNVVVDGVSMGAITTFTFTNVTAPHTISATFKPTGCTAPSPSAITGQTFNLCGVKEVTYKASAVSGATSYEWVPPSGFTIVSGQGTATLKIKTPATFSTAELKVRATTSCGTSPYTSLTINGAPGDLSEDITGPSEVVAGSVNIYSLPSTPGVSYTWTATGGTVVEGGTSPSVSIKAGTTNGHVQVIVKNACGTAPAAKKYFTVKPGDPCTTPTLSAAITNVSCLGAKTGSINLTAAKGTSPYTYQWSGPDGFASTDEDLSSLAPGNYSVTVTAKGSCAATATYSVTQPASALAIVVTPGIIPCSSTTTSVTVAASGGTAPYTGTGEYSKQTAGSHTYTVTDAQGCSVSKTIIISASSGEAPAAPAAITGQSADLCSGQNISYTASAVTGATSYEWTVPSGFTLVSGQGTTTITVVPPANFTTAQLRVRAKSACGASSYTSLTLHGATGEPGGEITGPSEVVTGSVNVYSLPATPGLSYSWSVDGGTVVGGENTHSASIKAGNTNGHVQAIVKNSCGTEFIVKKNFTVMPAFFNAYPNPVRDMTTVSFSAEQKDIRYDLTVIDSYGQVRMKKTGLTVAGINTLQLSLGKFAAGIYMVTLVRDNTISCQKLFKAN